MHDLSPWLSMWLYPRRTISSLLETNPKTQVFLLATLFSLQNLFYFANYWSLGLFFPFYLILPLAIVASPLVGWIWLELYSRIFFWTGKWFRGEAPLLYLKATVAWSNLPLLASLAVWFLLLVNHPQYAFIQNAKGFFVLPILFILSVWAFVLLLQSLREVQRFSLLRALANLFVANLIYSALLVLFFIFVRFIYVLVV